MRLVPYVLLSLLMFTAIGQAAEFEFKPPVKTIGKEFSGAYTLDKGHANVVFTVSHLGYSGYIGRFNSFDAELDFNAEDVTKSKVEATIQTGSVDTNHEVLESKLVEKDFFNTKSFPVATFTSTRIEKTGEDTGIIHGDLTFLGVTKPIMLQTVFNGGGDNPFIGKKMLGFSATTTFKRSDYGMNGYLPAIGDMVTLTIEVEFHKADPK